MLTSVDQEGTRKGFDLELLKAVSDKVTVPVIASGGMGTCQDFIDAVLVGRADAVAMADVLHFGRLSIGKIREQVESAGIYVRSL